MSDLYRKILQWHKLIAMCTGGLALCSAKHRLNRAEAMEWVTALRNVSDDIQTFLDTGEFILDSKGQREVKSNVAGCSDGGATPPAPGRANDPVVVPESSNPERSATLRKATRKS